MRRFSIFAVGLVSALVLAACGGGGTSGPVAGGGAGAQPVVGFSSPGQFASGEAVTLLTANVPDGSLGTSVDGTPVTVVQQDGQAIVVLPELTPGTHVLTVVIGGQTISLPFDVANLPTSADARQALADALAEAIRQLDAWLALHPDDAAAQALRDQLAAGAAELASLTDQQVQDLEDQLTANPLPPADLPASCTVASAQYAARLKATLRTADLAAWLAARHAAHASAQSHVAVVLAQARMAEALRRLQAYADAAGPLCNGDTTFSEGLSQAQANSHRSEKAIAALSKK